jgi:hypothetical protein
MWDTTQSRRSRENSIENFLIKASNLASAEKEFADSVKRPAASTKLLFERFFREKLTLFMAATSFFIFSTSSKTFRSWENTKTDKRVTVELQGAVVGA